MFELTPFTEDLLPGWVALHNAAFADAHNFWPVNARTLRRRVLGAPGFEPAHLLFARHGDALVGFAHGGPGRLYAIGVHPHARRAGVGGALVRGLTEALGPMRPDCRGMNPFWGNARGPETCFFGMVEGIGIADDAPVMAFFTAQGWAPGPRAVNLRVTPQALYLEPGREARRRAEHQGYEFGLMRRRCPALGEDTSRETPLAGDRWFSTVALLNGTVAGYAVAFETPELGPGRHGLFALEVAPEHRRRGLGSALVAQALLEMNAGPFTACEVTTVPEESPGAAELYERLGFAPCAAFRVFD